MYGSARKSNLQMLDHIHKQGLRFYLGAFRTFVEFLYIDAHEPSLGAKRAKYYLQYSSKIKSLPKYETHNAVFGTIYMKLFDARPNSIRTFGLRIKRCFRHFWNVFHILCYHLGVSNTADCSLLDHVHPKKHRTHASVYK